MLNPFVLVPIYFYPAGSAWSSLFTQIASNPTLDFSVIINVDNGPGDPTTDPNWITAISKLNAYNNTQLLGYIHTEDATRPISEVTGEINSYASWASYSSADLHVDGIFFDESPGDDTTDAVNYMTTIATYARTTLPPKNTSPYVTLNPGTPVSDSFYDIADMVVALEDDYSAYSAASIDAVPVNQRSKSAFIIYDFTSDATQQTTVLDAIINSQISGTYITDQSGYLAFSSIFPQFISAMMQMRVDEGIPSGPAAASVAPSSQVRLPSSSSSSFQPSLSPSAFITSTKVVTQSSTAIAAASTTSTSSSAVLVSPSRTRSGKHRFATPHPWSSEERDVCDQ